MVPDELRDLIGDVFPSEIVQDRVLRRFFPSMFQEALFCFRAQRSRGGVVCESDLIFFIPVTQLDVSLSEDAAVDPIKLMSVVADYDPQHESIVLMRYGKWWELLIASQRENPTSLGRYSPGSRPSH